MQFARTHSCDSTVTLWGQIDESHFRDLLHRYIEELPLPNIVLPVRSGWSYTLTLGNRLLTWRLKTWTPTLVDETIFYVLEKCSLRFYSLEIIVTRNIVPETFVEYLERLGFYHQNRKFLLPWGRIDAVLRQIKPPPDL